LPADTDPEIGRVSDPADVEPISLPTWAREADPLQPIRSHSRYGPPDLCMDDLTLLGILRPSSDDLPDFFLIHKPPP
jgi:hypothetical protein